VVLVLELSGGSLSTLTETGPFGASAAVAESVAVALRSHCCTTMYVLCSVSLCCNAQDGCYHHLAVVADEY